MSMAIFGLTHCPECGHPYKEMSFCCEYCEHEKEKIKKQKLDKLMTLDEDEIDYLIELAKKGGAEIKRNKLKAKIEELKKELGD